ncbi:DNA polymerase III subunit epsilon [Methylophilus sp. Leaf414]|nr:DNA polymerase III subunit epsilon [Methylophilus sp. Leaf414]
MHLPEYHWLPDMVILDIETTGGSHLFDRITEIALVRIEGGEIVDTWQSLINPGRSIPMTITHLTGITDEMVKNAPTFAEIAATLYQYLEGVPLAAHNVRFDYGFLKAEYQRIEATLHLRTLCTVRLSRRMFPEHKGHGLDAIIRRHGLTTTARHRAMGDVILVLEYLEKARLALGSVCVIEHIKYLSQGPSLPVGLEQGVVDRIPDSPGVYMFFGETDLPIYIGKSVKLRSRILNHFSSDHSSAKEMRIAQEVKHIEYIQTAGELGALLLESKLIKDRQPIYNRMLRRSRQLQSIRLAETLNQTPWLTYISADQFDPANFDLMYGMFRTKKSAEKVIRQLAIEHQLCPRLLGIESGKGACFAYQLKRCTGVCAGKEPPEIHYLRLTQALISIRLKSWPYKGRIGIREVDKATGKTQVQIFDQWCHIATVDDEIQMDEARQSRFELNFDLDTYKLLAKALKSSLDIIKF